MRKQRGRGRIGLAVIVVLAGALAYAVSEAQAEMELAQVDITIRNIRSGLQIAIGERLMRGDDKQVAALLTANPLEFLGQLPAGYVGQTPIPDGAGSWRFDSASRLLEYRPRHPRIFGGREELHWRLQATGAGRPVGLRLVAEG